MKQYVLSVNCASGVESVLKRELIALGLGEQKAVNGSFVFEGDANAVATCNMFLHTAEHVYLQLSQFEARDFDALFDGISPAIILQKMQSILKSPYFCAKIIYR